MPNISVDYLIVAGGGAGGTNGGGGGGAGGYRTGTTNLTSNTDYAIVVGAGGATSAQPGASGTNSTLLQPTPTTYSNYFDGVGDYLALPASTNLAVGTSDFTFETWIYLTGFNTWHSFISSRATASTAGATDVWCFGVHNTGYLYCYSGAMQVTGTVGAVTLNTWYHVAISRSGSSMRLFVNGTQTGTTGTTSQNYTDNTLTLGANNDGSEPIIGYMSNARLIKGTALYTTNFTTPAAPLTAVTNTVLLTCQSSTLVDTSTNAFAITKNGDVSVSTFNPTFGFLAAGGGGGAGRDAGGGGVTGGSGGGGADAAAAAQAVAGAGTAGQGNAGGAGTTNSGAGGGGGAGAAGTAASGGTNGAGGVGLSNSITGTAVFYAGGGGGARCPGLGSGGGAGGNGGGGAGASGGGTSGTANTGGGGGGNGGLGGSGVVIVRYLTSDVASATGGTATTDGLYTVRRFTSSGTLNLVQYVAGMPINTVAPVISGTVGIGNTFSCTTGTWTGDPTITYGYQWNRSGAPISGATSSTYTIGAGDGWSNLTCAVTAANSSGSLTTTSNSILLSITTYTSIDKYTGFNPLLAISVPQGNQITVAEAVSLNLTIATTRDIEDTNDLVKLAAVIPQGNQITVAEAIALNLTTATARDIKDVNDLVKLQATVATTYAYTDGAPISSIGGGTTGGTSGPANTENWYMG